MSEVWSKDEINYAKALKETQTYAEIAKILNAKFNTNRTVKAIERIFAKHPDSIDSIKEAQELVEGELSYLIDPKKVLSPKMLREAIAKPYIKLLEQVIEDNKVIKPYVPKKIAKAQTEVLMMGDWHIGKVIDLPVNKYNIEIATQRADQLCKNFLDVIWYSSANINFDEIALFLIGDFVENEVIFPTQAHHIEVDVVAQLMKATEIMWSKIILPIRTAIDQKIPITIHCVKGNHGRVADDTNESANWDLAMYKQLALISHFSHTSNIFFNISPYDFTSVEVKGHKGILRHEGVPNHDTPSARAKLTGWEGIHGNEFICMGHYHSPYIAEPNDIAVFQNGCLSGLDDLAERMAKGTQPYQLSWGVSEKRARTHIHFIDTID